MKQQNVQNHIGIQNGLGFSIRILFQGNIHQPTILNYKSMHHINIDVGLSMELEKDKD